MWESITYTVIQKCFAKCGSGIEVAVVAEKVGQDNSDRVELYGHVDYHSNFDVFLIVDQFTQTSEDQMAASLYVPNSEHTVCEWE
jgi:hypothetical protein